MSESATKTVPQIQQDQKSSGTMTKTMTTQKSGGSGKRAVPQTTTTSVPQQGKRELPKPVVQQPTTPEKPKMIAKRTGLVQVGNYRIDINMARQLYPTSKLKEIIEWVPADEIIPQINTSDMQPVGQPIKTDSPPEQQPKPKQQPEPSKPRATMPRQSTGLPDFMRRDYNAGDATKNYLDRKSTPKTEDRAEGTQETPASYSKTRLMSSKYETNHNWFVNQQQPASGSVQPRSFEEHSKKPIQVLPYQPGSGNVRPIAQGITPDIVDATSTRKRYVRDGQGTNVDFMRTSASAASSVSYTSGGDFPFSNVDVTESVTEKYIRRRRERAQGIQSSEKGEMPAETQDPRSFHDANRQYHQRLAALALQEPKVQPPVLPHTPTQGVPVVTAVKGPPSQILDGSASHLKMGVSAYVNTEDIVNEDTRRDDDPEYQYDPNDPEPLDSPIQPESEHLQLVPDELLSEDQMKRRIKNRKKRNRLKAKKAEALQAAAIAAQASTMQQQEQDAISVDSQGDPVRGPNQPRFLLPAPNQGTTGQALPPQEITIQDQGNQQGFYDPSLPNQGAVEETKDFQQAGNN